MGEQTAMVLSLWGMFSVVAAIVWTMTTNRRKQQIASLQANMQAKLLERLSNNQELAEFLKTDAGRRLLEPPIEAQSSPFRRILTSIQAGLVSSLLGAGLLIIRHKMEDASRDETLVFGTIALTVGLGFLLSAVASFALSKAWGLMNGGSSNHR